MSELIENFQKSKPRATEVNNQSGNPNQRFFVDNNTLFTFTTDPATGKTGVYSSAFTPSKTLEDAYSRQVAQKSAGLAMDASGKVTDSAKWAGAWNTISAIDQFGKDVPRTKELPPIISEDTSKNKANDLSVVNTAMGTYNNAMRLYGENDPRTVAARDAVRSLGTTYNKTYAPENYANQNKGNSGGISTTPNTSNQLPAPTLTYINPIAGTGGTSTANNYTNTTKALNNAYNAISGGTSVVGGSGVVDSGGGSNTFQNLVYTPPITYINPGANMAGNSATTNNSGANAGNFVNTSFSYLNPTDSQSNNSNLFSISPTGLIAGQNKNLFSIGSTGGK